MKLRRRRLSIVLIASVLGLQAAASALADSTPVGPLPPTTPTLVATTKGSLVSVALPRQRVSSGLVWRIARPVNPKVLRQTTEGDVGSTVVLVFKAVRAGRATISVALTKGESSSKAMRAVVYKVKVS